MQIRPARTSDIKGIRQLIDSYAPQGRLLSKETVTLYESVQEFTVAEVDGKVVGCGGLHVLWEDLAEVRTVAVLDRLKGQGVGHKILETINAQNGISDYKVICDESNNPASIVEANEFYAEVLIKPLTSINFITITLTNVDLETTLN